MKYEKDKSLIVHDYNSYTYNIKYRDLVNKTKSQ